MSTVAANITIILEIVIFIAVLVHIILKRRNKA